MLYLVFITIALLLEVLLAQGAYTALLSPGLLALWMWWVSTRVGLSTRWLVGFGFSVVWGWLFVQNWGLVVLSLVIVDWLITMLDLRERSHINTGRVLFVMFILLIGTLVQLNSGFDLGRLIIYVIANWLCFLLVDFLVRRISYSDIHRYG